MALVFTGSCGFSRAAELDPDFPGGVSKKQLQVGVTCFSIHTTCFTGSCGFSRAAELEPDFPGGVSKKQLQVGQRWILDAVQTMKKTLRVQLLRDLFLKAALLNARDREKLEVNNLCI